MKEKINIALISPFDPVPKGSKIVIFKDSKSFISEILSKDVIEESAQYAKKNNVYLVTQRFLYNNSICICMISNEGKLVSVQSSIYPNFEYKEYNIFANNIVNTFDTPFGKIAILVDNDYLYPQVARSAKFQGADFILVSSFVPAYDLVPTRTTFPLINIALSNDLPVVAALNSTGYFCTRKGVIKSSKYDSDSLIAEIIIEDSKPDFIEEIKEAKSILITHKDYLYIGGEK